MANVANLSVSLTAQTSKFRAGMRGARKPLRDFRSSAKNTTATMLKFTAAMAAVAIGIRSLGGAVSRIRNAFASLDSLAKTSDKLGMVPARLQALRMAAEETGVASNTLDMGLQRMVRRISEAAQGSGEAKDAIKELGLSAQWLNQQTPDQQFAAIATAMENVTNQGDRVRLAMRLFDSEGVALVNTLALGRKGLDDVAEASAKLYGALDRVDLAKIENANDAWERMQRAMTGMVQTLAIQLAPFVETVALRFTDAATAGEGMHDRVVDAFEGIANAIAHVIGLTNQLKVGFHGGTAVADDMAQGMMGYLAALWKGYGGSEEDIQKFRNLQGFARGKRHDALANMESAASGDPVQDVKDFFAKIRADATAHAQSSIKGGATGNPLSIPTIVSDELGETPQDGPMDPSYWDNLATNAHDFTSELQEQKRIFDQFSNVGQARVGGAVAINSGIGFHGGAAAGAGGATPTMAGVQRASANGTPGGRQMAAQGVQPVHDAQLGMVINLLQGIRAGGVPAVAG